MPQTLIFLQRLLLMGLRCSSIVFQGMLAFGSIGIVELSLYFSRLWKLFRRLLAFQTVIFFIIHYSHSFVVLSGFYDDWLLICKVIFGGPGLCLFGNTLIATGLDILIQTVMHWLGIQSFMSKSSNILLIHTFVYGGVRSHIINWIASEWLHSGIIVLNLVSHGSVKLLNFPLELSFYFCLAQNVLCSTDAWFDFSLIKSFIRLILLLMIRSILFMNLNLTCSTHFLILLFLSVCSHENIWTSIRVFCIASGISPVGLSIIWSQSFNIGLETHLNEVWASVNSVLITFHLRTLTVCPSVLFLFGAWAQSRILELSWLSDGPSILLNRKKLRLQLSS